MEIEIYSKDDCPYCTDAKNWLTVNNLSYREIKENDYDKRQKLYDQWGLKGGARTMPQIFVVDDGERTHIGDSNALKVSGLA